MSSRWLTLKRKFLSLSNEGIGAAICAGAYLGGKTPAMIIATRGAFGENGLCLIVAKIEPGSVERREYAGMDQKFNKYLFATYIEETEKKPVLGLRSRSPFTQK